MKVLSKITNIVNKASLATGVITIICLISMAGLICADVFMRLAFSSPIKGSYETLQLLLLTAIFCGMAYTQCEKGHVHVLVVVTWIPKKAGYILYGLMELLTTVIAVIMTRQCLAQTIRVYESKNATITWMLPWWPFEALATVGMIVFCIALAWDTIKYFGAAFNEELAAEIQF